MIICKLYYFDCRPSSSKYEDRLPKGVVKAEVEGHQGGCDYYRSLCPIGLYDLIATIVWLNKNNSFTKYSWHPFSFWMEIFQLNT